VKRLAVVALLALAAAVPSATAAPTTFKPAVLDGTWAGTWNNLTFKTKGTLSLKITSTTGNKLVFAATITGNTFGCTPPGPQMFTLPTGAGANHWTANGFTIANPNAAFGKMNVIYSYPLGTLAGSGKNPKCAPGLSWKLAGKFTTKKFSATAYITLPGGGKATTVVQLAKK
jgi:hypothetical protein